MAASAKPTPAAPATSNASNDKTMGIVAWVLMIFTAWLGPLIIWLISRENRGASEANARGALNFGITATIVYILCFIVGMILAFTVPLMSFLVMLLYLAVWACLVIFGIMGAMAANRGEVYKAPFGFTFIKG